jgi:polyhydroxybutyrate depolymerase
MGRSWNAGGCCGPARRYGIDDVGFLSALIDSTAEAEGVDEDRVYVAGISNGAMMAYRLACDLPGRLAAIGAVAGTMVCDCPAPAPTSVLHIHGLEDGNIPFAGGLATRGVERQSRPSVPDVIAVWRRAGGCGPSQVTEAPPVRTEVWAGPAGIDVALLTVAGAGHQWPGSRPPDARVSRMLNLDPTSTALDATAVLWSFFAAHRRPS